MKVNEGSVDRILRVTFGAAILSLAFWGPESNWAFLGLVPIVTGLVGICPIYSILGVNTCRLQK